jgi:hypothetical protein
MQNEMKVALVFTVALTVLGLISTSHSNAQSQPPLLTSASAPQWRAAIEPDSQEALYLQISWRESLLRGLLEAKREDKPVMLFAMNGHPLGCT